MIPPEARGAWLEVAARLRPYVARRVASAADVEDIVQDTFLRMHRGLDGLADGERFGPWVYRIATSAISDRVHALVTRWRQPMR